MFFFLPKRSWAEIFLGRNDLKSNAHDRDINSYSVCLPTFFIGQCHNISSNQNTCNILYFRFVKARAQMYRILDIKWHFK